MIQSTNQVSLYKKFDMKLSELSGLEISTPTLSYENSEGEKFIQIDSETPNYINVNEFDTEWAPSEFNLKINQKFTVKNPSVLFGEKGITMPGNEIGVAVHLHSKSSSVQKNIAFGIIKDLKEEVELIFEHNFPKSSIRGRVSLDFYLFLKTSLNSHPYHASNVGMRLSKEDLLNLTILVDGEGSVFPISEFKDPNGPLWKLDKNWVDPSIDSFDMANVNLSLNIAHPLFAQVKAGKTKVAKAMMSDIMVQVMALIIQQVVIIENYDIEQDDQATPDSILTAVRYWISTFEVDTSSLFSIMNSLRASLENNLNGGDSGD